MRLGCVVSVLVAPLLLLAAPGRAEPHAATGQDTGGVVTARAAGSSGAVTAHRGQRSTTSSWALPLVEAAAYTPPPPPTTTTTAPPAPVAPVVHVAVATTVPTTLPPTTTTTAPPPQHQETGQASWYQAPAGTCASPSLAYGTVVTVTDLGTGKSVTCTVDDRQDPSSGRVLDLAEATFAELADPSVGVIEVRLSW